MKIKNPRTTLGGVITLVIAVLMAVKALLSPEDSGVDWNELLGSIAAAAAGLGLVAARDSNKTSEQVGAGR